MRVAQLLGSVTLVFLAVCAPSRPSLQSTDDSLRVMTFNIWNSGANVANGQQKIAKHILLLNPDIVALQEVYSGVCQNLTLMLGGTWVAVENPRVGYPDTAILTRHVVVPDTTISTASGVGLKILLRTGQMVYAWSLHLDYTSYGPYAAYNKMVTSEQQIMAGENLGRGPQIQEILQHPTMEKWMEKSGRTPLLVCGDFNGPSHLDWIEQNRVQHGGWAVSWPATRNLAARGFVDSYRVYHYDPLASPGYTWSTVNKFNSEWNYTIPEPEDRIDFIHFIGPLAVVQSSTYCGSEDLKRIPFQWENDYPSDHFAVFTDFFFA